MDASSGFFPTRLRLYNSLGRRKEPFHPLRGKQVRMYVCGPTVYGVCHMGHARSYVVFDVIARHLRYLGYDVRLVINFTDVEEKITERAEEVGMDPLRFADEKIDEFFRVMDALNIRRADEYPRVSEHVSEMIEVVQRLLDRGVAYHLGKKIFFDVKEAGGYGALLGSVPEEAVVPDEPPEGIEARRRSYFDFEVWDGSVTKDPLWESPWGRGRVGWHVECYVMSKVLGHPIDIKGGGRDLVFPHHESTKLIASALGEELSRFYIHNGFLTFMDQKMSKSKGIYVNIADALDSHSPESLRFFILSTHYRENLAFSDEAVREAGRRFSSVQELCRKLGGITKAKSVNDEKFLELVDDLKSKYESSMNDDLDTPLALAAVNDFVNEVAPLKGVGRTAAKKGLTVLARIGHGLGLSWAKPS